MTSSEGASSRHMPFYLNVPATPDSEFDDVKRWVAAAVKEEEEVQSPLAFKKQRPVVPHERVNSSSILDDSPIEQVRLTVPPTDDNTLQVLTFRTWFIGIPICILGSVIAALSSYRQQLFYLSQVCINIIVLIVGKLMANMLPNKVVRMPYTNWGFSLNPGPFNLKEHVVTTILAGTESASAGFEILSMSKIFYHKDIPLLPAMLLVLSIQVISDDFVSWLILMISNDFLSYKEKFLGYGFAGIFTKLLVDSPYMWWPSTLVDVSFYRALHEPEKRVKGKLSRYQFFVIVIVVIFTYSIVPVYLFPSITALSFVCWIWKDSITAQQIGSGFNGLGIGSFALDWITMSSYVGNPLPLPAFVVINMMVGFILILYVLLPLSYWNNVYDAKRFPIFTSSIFDVHGQFYNVSRVLDEKSLTFNEEAYNNYSKLYFSASLMLSYGFILAAFTSSISHVALFYGR
ncbi:oligopeptide transporter 5-like [Musa acuminata AAA Group]